MTPVKFATGHHDVVLIHKIAKRAFGQVQSLPARTSRLDIVARISAAHANGCPLDLERLLTANDIGFATDIAGIFRHLNPRTGQLVGFTPVFRLRTQTGAAA